MATGKEKWVSIKEDLPFDSEKDHTLCLVAWRPKNMTEEECRALSGGPHFFGLVGWDMTENGYVGWNPEDVEDLTRWLTDKYGEAEILAWKMPEYYQEEVN